MVLSLVLKNVISNDFNSTSCFPHSTTSRNIHLLVFRIRHPDKYWGFLTFSFSFEIETLIICIFLRYYLLAACSIQHKKKLDNLNFVCIPPFLSLAMIRLWCLNYYVNFLLLILNISHKNQDKPLKYIQRKKSLPKKLWLHRI